MRFQPAVSAIATAFLLFAGPFSVAAVELPERELAATFKAFYAPTFNSDWRGVEMLPGIKWAPLPPTMLQNCLPAGGCFTRLGQASIGGRNYTVVATGARTMMTNLYVRSATPGGGDLILKALAEAGVSADLARCPIPSTQESVHWYRVSGPAIRTGVLSVRTTCQGQRCEAFILTQGPELPPLAPAELKLYSEQCGGPSSERRPVTTVLPHEALAKIMAALIPPASGPALRDWKVLQALSSGIAWPSAAPQTMNLSFKNDSNPVAQSADLSVSGRKLSVLASGTSAQPKTIHVDEAGMHPQGEHLLGELYRQGFAVQLVRCGPVYSTSTNNWYRVTSAATHPVMLRQSLRYEGNQVQDTYELRLDNTLPARDGRDRDPGVNGCK